VSRALSAGGNIVWCEDYGKTETLATEKPNLGLFCCLSDAGRVQALVSQFMHSHISRRQLLGGLLSATAAGLLPLSAAPALAGPSGLAVQAVKIALTGDFIGAGDLANRSGDQAAIKLVELLYLRDHGSDAGYARIHAFLNAAPKWPLTDTLKKRAEQSLYENNQDVNLSLQHFADEPPLTAYGMLAYARALYATGDAANAKTWLAKVWNCPAVATELEPKILSEFGSQLTAADHRNRVRCMIYAQEGSAALRNAKRVGGDYVAAATVAQLLLRGTTGADARYAALPGAMRNDLSLKFALARFYRRQEKFDKARAVLSSVQNNPAANRDAKSWWGERRIIIRRSVGPNHGAVWNAAYQMAANHGDLEIDDMVEAEFLAGWIALRYLKQPDTALKHFIALQQIAPSRTDRARANYWIGRTQLVMGNKTAAKAAFNKAAQTSTVYYGQLAREAIGLGTTPEDINSGQASSAAISKVQNDEVVRAMRIFAQAGTKNQLNIFLWSLANRFNSTDELNAAAAEVQNIAGTSWSLRLAKAASQRGLDIDSWAYPVRGLPNWSQVGKPIEKSLVFALSRQESEFDPNAGSSVGAQGLMQLMPATAKIVARQYRMPFAANRLKSDPTYNVQLGSAHLADLVENFGGSYVLTLVGYNAGPRRSREWVNEFGDPRGGQVDPIDWVECIPFEETRQYVQKVLQNVHVYRSRLAPKTVRPMTADLMRGAPADVAVSSTSPVEASVTCKTTAISAMLGGTCG
jgi:soluble lytic murein transglycosylase